MPDTYALYQRAAARPFGKRAFSWVFASRAPYFRSVRPRVREVRPHHAELTIRKRRAVQNHIGTVHAIAVCNGLEAAMGLLAEATTPRGMRWIPKGMEVAYVAKATSDLLCIAESDPALWTEPGDVAVNVRAEGEDGVVVVEGTISVYVSARPST